MKRGVSVLLGFFFALAAACPGMASGSQESGVRSLVDTGHTGAIRGLQYDDRRNLLFSAGDDGTVRIWDAGTDTPLRKLQVTQLSAEMLAVSPAAPEVAVVVTDDTGSFSLSMWDWEKERQVFRVTLKEEPLFLRFSGQGNYLLYSDSSWQSLKILRTSDGAPVSFHPEGFGIVGFAEMSQSEKIIMTYQVSGRISYWDFATGQNTLDLPSVPYVAGIHLAHDRSFLVGTTGAEVVVVDAVTGSERASAPLPNVTSLDISPADDELACVSGPDRSPSRWTIGRGVLTRRAGAPLPAAGASLLRYGDDMLFLAEPSGGLAALSSSGAVTHFGDNVLASLTGFDAARGLVALGSRDWVRVLSSDLLSGARSPAFLRTVLAKNPFGTAVGVSFLSPESLLAWQTGDAPPGLALLNLPGLAVPGGANAPPYSADSKAPPYSADSEASFLGLQTGFRAPLVDLRPQGNAALGVETGGVLRLTDIATGGSRFDVRIPGAYAVVASSPTELIAGRNAGVASEGSLVRINMQTGETVAIRDRNLFSYGLLVDPGAGSTGALLYTVGVDTAGATNLLLHDGPGFERETLLDSVAEEDLDVSLALDPETHVLFASLGRDRLVSWDGKQIRTILLENTVPRRLVAVNGLLFSLNKDSTVAVADGATGARLAEISLFADGEWCALLRDGMYAASPGGDVHVRVFANGIPVKATEDYRIRPRS